jgi:hypothetical protein
MPGGPHEIVLVRPGAVWAVVRSRVPHPVGSGTSRGRGGASAHGRWVWRNMMFRNLSDEPASQLIRSAVAMTALEWVRRYGELPDETLQTEVRAAAVRSEIPGYCYRRAGWVKYRETRGLVYFRCPRPQIERALALGGAAETAAGPRADVCEALRWKGPDEHLHQIVDQGTGSR